MTFTEELKNTVLSIFGDLGTEVTKSLTTGREKDVFSLVSFDFTMESANYGIKPRQIGSFTMEFLVSPMSTTGEPLVSFDNILDYFINNQASKFSTSKVTVLSYVFGQSTLITDKTTGSNSLIFSLNIDAIEKR